MGFLFFAILVVMFIGWFVVRNRFQDLEEKLRNLDERGDTSEKIRVLTARVYQLECALAKGEIQAVPAVEIPIKAVPAAPPPLPVVVQRLEPRPVPQPTPPVFVPPQTPVVDRLRNRMSGQEWEALVGGNVLNKLGALVLVVGIALFLGYAFTQMGAGGRAATGLAVSLSLLASGILVERKERYKVFARGLIGAGWASLYFTTYALYAVEATRVIGNPIVGSVLLLVVAAAMIGHTLRYGSQGATGVAYFSAFAALAAAPSTPFAAAALLPLALSLLFIAHRFSWYPMALFGLIATYGTLISRGDYGSPLASTQTLLFFYWLLFECFDLMRVARRVTNGPAVAIFPLNTAVFLVLSFQKWSKAAPDQTFLFAAGAAGLYLLSAVIRWRVHPPYAEDGEPLDSARRLTAGGYEAPAIVSSVLAGLAIFAKVPGVWASAGVALEAEILFLAGLKLRERLLERLGVAGFVFSLGRLAGDTRRTEMFGRLIYNNSPAALLHAAIFYANRAIRGPGLIFSYSASSLVALVLVAECPERFLGTALAAFGLILFELGLRRQLPEYRYQGYGAMALGVMATCAFNSAPDSRNGWIQLAIGIAIAYFMSVRSLKVPEAETNVVRWGAAISTSLLALILAAKLVPAAYLGMAWALIAAALLELGLHGMPAQLRRLAWLAAGFGAAAVVVVHFQDFDKFAGRSVWLSYAAAGAVMYWFAFRNQARPLAASAGSSLAMTAIWIVMPDILVAPAWATLAVGLVETGLDWHGNLVFAAVFGRVFLANFTNTGYSGPISHRILTVVPLIAAHYHVWYRGKEASASPLAMRLHLWAPAILAFVLLRFELGRVYTVAGWAMLGLALLYVGLRANLEDLKRQSYGIAVLTFLRCIASNFFIPESLGGLATRLAIAACVIGAFYSSQFLVPRETRPRIFFSMLATALLTSVIFHEVSGSMLTVAWGIEGILLLMCGFPLRERVLRLSGLAMLLYCILKLFLFDLRNLETMARILSFIALGIILMAVSWIYTRFRERIRQYL